METEPARRLRVQDLSESGGIARVRPAPGIKMAQQGVDPMIRKLASGYRIYSRKKNPKTGKRRNLGTFRTRKEAEKHEREIQYFKRH